MASPPPGLGAGVMCGACEGVRDGVGCDGEGVTETLGLKLYESERTF